MATDVFQTLRNFLLLN